LRRLLDILLSKLQLISASNCASCEQLRVGHRRRSFQVSPLQAALEKRFPATMETDGIPASVHFVKPMPQSHSDPRFHLFMASEEPDSVVSVVPGLQNIS